MTKNILIGLFCLIFGKINGQTTPYFELPEERTSQSSQTFPNLDIQINKLYIRAEGSLKIQSSNYQTDLIQAFTIQKNLFMNWGGMIGYNYGSKWNVETGYLKNPLFTSASIILEPFYFISTYGTALHTIPFRFQRSIFTLDRVSKAARLYVGAGLLYSLGTEKMTNMQDRIVEQFRYSSSPQQIETIEITSITSMKKAQWQAEASLEVRGKLIEQLEIGVFYKAQLSQPNAILSDLTIKHNTTTIGQASMFNKIISHRFGISAHYNFALIKKYISKI